MCGLHSLPRCLFPTGFGGRCCQNQVRCESNFLFIFRKCACFSAPHMVELISLLLISEAFFYYCDKGGTMPASKMPQVLQALGTEASRSLALHYNLSLLSSFLCTSHIHHSYRLVVLSRTYTHIYVRSHVRAHAHHSHIHSLLSESFVSFFLRCIPPTPLLSLGFLTQVYKAYIHRQFLFWHMHVLVHAYTH